MSFVIICDSQYNADTLFLTPRKPYWSTELEDAVVYSNKGAAQRRLRTLRFNHPRMVTLEEARQIDREQQFHYATETMDDIEMGWDAHKGWL